jgi:hypothetical protein
MPSRLRYAFSIWKNSNWLQASTCRASLCSRVNAQLTIAVRPSHHLTEAHSHTYFLDFVGTHGAHEVLAEAPSVSAAFSSRGAHNTVRANVGVPPVSWDTTVATYGDAFAQKRHANCTGVRSYSLPGYVYACAYVDSWVRQCLVLKFRWCRLSHSCTSSKYLNAQQMEPMNQCTKLPSHKMNWRSNMLGS